MSQRDSGYERRELDCYETPEWVTDALIPHLRQLNYVWEPAAGSGKMVRALQKHGLKVSDSDIKSGKDFLDCVPYLASAIITNPPYEKATEFIERALHLMKSFGLVAMLLRTDFDHARTRAFLFGKHPAFAKKIVLTKRIRWIEGSTGSPSFNHAWFIWDWKHEGPPTLAYH